MESVYQFTSFKSIWGLPCWLKNKKPANAETWVRLLIQEDPTSHMPEQLNLSVTITEPCSAAEELQLRRPTAATTKLLA